MSRRDWGSRIPRKKGSRSRIARGKGTSGTEPGFIFCGFYGNTEAMPYTMRKPECQNHSLDQDALRIKTFYGTSENAVKTQILIAVSVYILVAIVRKPLGMEASPCQILQILSLTPCEKTPILRAPSDIRLRKRLRRYWKPIDPVRFVAGQPWLIVKAPNYTS
jgi:hypothetical protein